MPDPRDDEETRQREWQAKLGRLRLGAEPLEVQLERYRRVTWMLTAVPAGLAFFFFLLFSAFRRPGIGAVVALSFSVPIIVIAWVDFLRLRNRACAYWRECDPMGKAKTKTPGGA